LEKTTAMLWFTRYGSLLEIGAPGYADLAPRRHGLSLSLFDHTPQQLAENQ
jgi:hypothetical protein